MGLTEEAFKEGATLFRPEDSIGYVVIDLDEAMNDKKSRYNIILKDLDTIYIPKQQDLVRIIGFTNAAEIYPDKILTDQNGIAVPYHGGKNAKFYVDQYAAGVGEEGDVCNITVEHANGSNRENKEFPFLEGIPESPQRIGHKSWKEVRRKAQKSRR